MPASNSPYFTIVVPAFNRAHTIDQTLKSLLQQTYKDFEVLIIDDGSTDETYEVVDKYLTDSRFKYFYKINEERAVARNFGIDQAKGQFITFLDSDDGYYNYCLDEAKCFVRNNPQAHLFHLSYEIIHLGSNYVEKKISKNETLNHKLLTGNQVSCINIFVKREILKKEKFDTNPCLTGSEDYELWLRLAAKYPFYSSPKVSAYMVQHPGRSVLVIKPHKLKKRMNCLLSKVSFNPSIIEAYSCSGVKKIQAHTYLYWSLHLAMGGFTLESFRHMFKGLKISTDLIGIRKVGGILKVALMRFLSF